MGGWVVAHGILVTAPVPWFWGLGIWGLGDWGQGLSIPECLAYIIPSGRSSFYFTDFLALFSGIEHVFISSATSKVKLLTSS